uniref:Uncharacterized protein n=1 Tax=Rhizophora mucronata TaxID=61149 RepID=A0A2P2N1I0_RHIMU
MPFLLSQILEVMETNRQFLGKQVLHLLQLALLVDQPHLCLWSLLILVVPMVLH